MCVVKGVVLCLRCSIWLALLSSSISPTTPVSSSSQEGTHNPEDYILVPFLKVLMDTNGWDFRVPTRPDAKYLRYMKRFYTLSATPDGIPKRPTNYRYNTVRLLTPRAESRHTEVFEQDVYGLDQDVVYGLDPVTVGEQLLRSVLLYSVEKSFPILCHCNLTVQEPAPLSDQMCSDDFRSHHFHVQFERSSRKRHKWLEVDLASFLQPFVGPRRGDLRLAFSYLCAKADENRTGGPPLKPRLLAAPSLLLFLNDTHEQARAHLGGLSAGLGPQSSPRKSLWAGMRSGGRRRQRRGPKDGGLGRARRLPRFHYPDHECQLHDFRLSFSQLRWDRWIIAPHSYNPRYCQGSCPRALSHRYGSPVHTLIQNILFEKLDSSIPRPSCVPAQYNPLSVLTLEKDGSIAYKEYDHMIATTCTCR